MERFKLSSLTIEQLEQYVTILDQPIQGYPWLQVEAIAITDDEQQQIRYLLKRITNSPTNLMNEATLWAKVIFPLLALAERGMIEVFAEVNLSTQYVRFSLDGIADGILGKAIAGRLKVPYLVMVEAKRGIEGTDPVAQLYGQLLCGAHKNWQANHQEPQELFGCFTIGQTWQFLRAEVSLFEGDRPQLYVECSPEYTEKAEAVLILKILKGIVNHYEDQKSFPEKSV